MQTQHAGMCISAVVNSDSLQMVLDACTARDTGYSHAAEASEGLSEYTVIQSLLRIAGVPVGLYLCHRW